MSILIIDDDAEDIEYFQEILQTVDHTCLCVTASSCEDGLAQLRSMSTLPSHVFLDGMLYGMSSMDCLKEIKHDADLHGISVIMYSGYAHPDVKEEFLRSGADLFLMKPTYSDQLERALRSILAAPATEIQLASLKPAI
jgi:CheY-like chemotaxis protein